MYFDDGKQYNYGVEKKCLNLFHCFFFGDPTVVVFGGGAGSQQMMVGIDFQSIFVFTLGFASHSISSTKRGSSAVLRLSRRSHQLNWSLVVEIAFT
jgi:hypothetical protein